MGILALIGLVIVIWILFSIATEAVGLIFALVIWGIIGWLAGKLMKGSGYGALTNVLLGLAGGVIGGIVFRLLNIDLGGLPGTVIVGVVGSIILIALGRLLSGRR